jgi:hypothetical protein
MGLRFFGIFSVGTLLAEAPAPGDESPGLQFVLNAGGNGRVGIEATMCAASSDRPASRSARASVCPRLNLVAVRAQSRLQNHDPTGMLLRRARQLAVDHRARPPTRVMKSRRFIGRSVRPKEALHASPSMIWKAGPTARSELRRRVDLGRHAFRKAEQSARSSIDSDAKFGARVPRAAPGWRNSSRKFQFRRDQRRPCDKDC